MRRRAELVDQTRQRIIEATVRLHTSLGPANTTIAAVAAEADVTRLTVYRHFPDIEQLFAACRAQWRADHPEPDPDRWRAIPDLGDRARAAFTELYGWYAENASSLFPIYRDADTMPAPNRAALRTDNVHMADAIVLGEVGRQARAVAGHLVSFWTWRSLTEDQGLTNDEAAALASGLVLAAVRADAEDGS